MRAGPRDRRLWWAATVALRAPSLGNSQPWCWVVGPSHLELQAVTERALPRRDPDGRGLVLSCGVSLHHAQVGLRACALEPVTTLLPDGPGSTLMARITGVPRHRGAEDLAVVLALLARRTDRRRLTGWPVPPGRLDRLVDEARSGGACALAVGSARSHWWARTLLEEARRTAPHRSRGSRPPEGRTTLRAGDPLVVLGGPRDDVDAWLVSGVALGRAWLRAQRDDLALVPLSEVVEVPGTRAALRRHVVEDRFEPHLLLRVGWRPIGRPPEPSPPRLPTTQVLRPVGRTGG